MKILAFGYKKRVGKDTAAQMALSYFRSNYTDIASERLSFFDAAKMMCVSIFGWAGLQDGTYYEDHPEAREQILPAIGKSPRQIWDSFGFYLNDICPKTLPEIAFKKISPRSDIVICSDVRKPIEVDYIRRYKESLIIKINRPDAPIGGPIDNLLDTYTEWDAVIDNIESIRSLNQKIRAVISEKWDL